jgi:hypothetical protein
MLLLAIIEKDELATLVRSMTPLRIAIDGRRGRSVTLREPDLVELVPDRGLRLRGDAHIMWDVAGVGLGVRVQAWQVLLIPKVAPAPSGNAGGRRVLLLEPLVEELDLKLVPSFLDDKLASAIRDGIAQAQGRLAWDFARALTKRVPLPAERMETGGAPLHALQLEATDGMVAISDRELRLAVRYEARLETRGSRAVVAKPGEAPRSRSAPMSTNGAVRG